MKKLVVLSSRFPYPLVKGDKLRLYHQLKYLSKHFEIHLLSTIEVDLNQGVAHEVTQYCKSFKYFRIPKSSQAIGLATNIFSSLPFQVKYFFDKKIKERIAEEVMRIEPDIVFCQLIRMAPYANDLEYPLVIDYMDAFSLIMNRQYKSEKRFYKKWFYNLEAKRLKRYEQKVQNNYQAKTIISEQDKNALEGITGLEVITNGVDLDYFERAESPIKHYDILFAGNMGYKPNVAAAKYLIKEIVEEQTYKVLIAGARPITEVQQLASKDVTISGWVKDIRDAYHKSKIFVAPLFEGAGQQNKILQAMAIGVPCITTHLVNNAIGAKDGTEVLIANDKESFKAHIKRLLGDIELANNLACNARKFVESKYSWAHQNAKLAELINSVT